MTISNPVDPASVIRYENKLLIDGKWLDAQSGATFTVENPATGEIIARAAAGGPEDVDLAVKAARRAFEGPWSELPPMQRARLMLKLADVLEAHAEEFAHIDTLDVGQPLWLSRGGAGGA